MFSNEIVFLWRCSTEIKLTTYSLVRDVLVFAVESLFVRFSGTTARLDDVLLWICVEVVLADDVACDYFFFYVTPANEVFWK